MSRRMINVKQMINNNDFHLYSSMTCCEMKMNWEKPMSLI